MTDDATAVEDGDGGHEGLEETREPAEGAAQDPADDAPSRRRRKRRGLRAKFGTDPYYTFEPRRVAVALVVGFLAVTAVAFATKALVESTTDLTYTIHFESAVPLLTVGFALLLNGEWNRRSPPEGAPWARPADG